MRQAPQIFSSIAVIVIEDSEEDYRLLLGELCATDVRVAATRVENSIQLRDALFSGRYDAVISEIQLPGFSSLQALKQVRSFDPHLPFLVVSSALGEEPALQAMRAGADDCVPKEELGRVLPALDRALRSAANRRGWRRAEAALQESETRFAALTENLPGMVFQMQYSDKDLLLLYVSEGSRRMLGVASEDLLAKPALLFDSLTLAGAAQLRRMLIEPTSTAAYLTWEGELNTPAGAPRRSSEISARARHVDSGAILWDGILTDVSAAKRAQLATRELASHLTRVREEERESIARELHDDIGSTLSAVKFELAWLKNASRQAPAMSAKLQEVEQLIDAVIASSSRMTQDLRPGIIDEGLVASLEWQARAFERRMGIPCSFRSSHEDIELNRDRTVAMFRVCQEALNNIAKHAHATAVDINLTAIDDTLMLEIHDNGRGITPADKTKDVCFGVRGMNERARSVGGEIDIRGDADHGTTITFLLSRIERPSPSELQMSEL